VTTGIVNADFEALFHSQSVGLVLKEAVHKASEACNFSC